MANAAIKLFITAFIKGMYVNHTVNNSSLHHAILSFLIERGFAPDVAELAAMLETSETDVMAGLQALQEYHGVVLHPNSSKVWVIHPFATAPTNFVVKSAKGQWWGNCAWCSLGVAALLAQDVSITTTLGAMGEQITLQIKDGQLVDSDYVVHFPVPMRNAWDNVMYTCSVMLIFKNESEVDLWCAAHRIPKGDVQPISRIWEFSKAWYGNHLNPAWTKWTTEQAAELFKQYELTSDTWNIPVSQGRF